MRESRNAISEKMILTWQMLAKLRPSAAAINKQEANALVRAKLILQEYRILLDEPPFDRRLQTVPCWICRPLDQIQMAGGAIIVRMR
jgi:hypothetical protein